MKIKIEVYQADINRGVKKSVSQCPIARALRRAIKGCESVSVDSPQISFRLNQKKYVATTTRKLFRFIRDFDAKGKSSVNPISSTILAKESV